MLDLLIGKTILAFFVLTGMSIIISVLLFELWILIQRIIGFKQRFFAVRFVNVILVICSFQIFVQLIVISGKDLVAEDAFIFAFLLWISSMLFYMYKRFQQKAPH